MKYNLTTAHDNLYVLNDIYEEKNKSITHRTHPSPYMYLDALRYMEIFTCTVRVVVNNDGL